ncbi:hypothetical protein COU19_02995 [Candidatus Kaiserbacteria bacterium CG10_big_fil_rev_8_21_14_0_10_56_12]|uniref:POTRA domain-containing protein n=1 Tax=Candidatus Kaiserbacteria bacterium CG10_big_fil_rev_8_21_14_0_10_56_12 TaxID=1974611 RepID=A0A2H0U961_9BACT|nr:MAG: hypothetical protein COU19_02995 [Candidatus Kaiserbacteria bacterium CG10_big_fil_rev_8_21_14_0_10_56_12]
MLAVVLVCLLLGLVMYALWQPAVRISHVEVLGADQSLANAARGALQGTYLGLVPRDSILFYPAGAIRGALMARKPDIAAVSIFRNGLNGLTVRVSDRVPVARWCPESSVALSTTSSRYEDCFVFDAGGQLYATSTSVALVNSFILHTPLARGVASRGTILPQAEKLPTVFNFAREVAILGSPVVAVQIADGAVNDTLESGTRITYLLGHEQAAYTALLSARDKLNIADGSLEYVDLRFDGKMYIKRKSDTLAQ